MDKLEPNSTLWQNEIKKAKSKNENRKTKGKNQKSTNKFLDKSKNENRKSKNENRKSKFFSESPNQSISFARGGIGLENDSQHGFNFF